MSNGGFFLVHRKLWVNAMFLDEPFTKREAWLWLISEACYDGEDRGQVVVSFRQLSKAWQWPTTKVFRFFDRLKNAGMIETASKFRSGTLSGTLSGTPDGLLKTSRSMVISICNYAKYQERRVKSEIEKKRKVEHFLERKVEHTLKKEPSTLRFKGSILKEEREAISKLEKGSEAERDAQVARWEAQRAGMQRKPEPEPPDETVRLARAEHARRVIADLAKRKSS